ncbi:alpha-L-arabinofuranosidase [Microbispora triticiradicis]|uniref:Alpha-L-arabinofuranosidase n=4 Tax=Microbispora TaxID=2005 RepID=A0A5J5K0A1_9ACTN|nr:MULTISPECIES: arabinofuranosidase catalytic domain-containing protein [Microbispora]KAA9375994.1 alpha-L-arabinofuranosidase [Microbispora cellulosiformans]RGA05597.1 alpha-L-arabinofuranosidase [Microbispora triticiradicis]TLP57884.1 alpha-L-arabinofuranosidase [Microbispora fusca]
MMLSGYLRRALAAGASALLATACLVGGGTAQAATSQPCDIYAAGGTPCVAAHSTTRALYGNYNGPLYQVRRSSDNTTRDIGVLSPGGVANAAAQDSFCAGTNCVITIIYDQSGRNNRLTQAPPGYWKGPAAGGYDNLADAKAAPITIGGQKAYGVRVEPGTGYRNNHTNGVATGDQPEGIYAVVDGTHYNQWCCFDYGNAQTDGIADSPAIMETVYFGADKQWGYGAGAGPWIMADLEWGLFSGVNAGYNNLAPINHRFVTAMVKGEPNHWAIRGGDAQSGGLTNYFDGRRPNGYNPMKKEGAILLGIGGDNSVSGRGTFFEGVLTSGYPSAATEDAVQANIAAAGYAPAGGTPQQGVEIVGGQSGRCVDVPNSSTANGTQLQLWDCWSGTNQRFTYTSGKQLQVYGNKCLDAYGQGTANGTQVIIWDCNGQANQQWNVNSNGTITGVQSGKCMEASNFGTANGTKVQLWSCTGTTSQKWTLRS